MKTLVLGGARSGKSRYAETLAQNSRKNIIYLATGWAGDPEMAARIEHHQQHRPDHWHTVEEPLQLAEVLQQHNTPDNLILIDCLTLWVSNCIEQGCYQTHSEKFLAALPQQHSDVVMVSNEVGSGLVPLGNLSREFVDTSGRLHQSLASLCDDVYLVVAGLPLPLKSHATPTNL